jgi:integral membrane protein
VNLRTLFRFVGWLEALSYLLLLGVAMPLKYVWGDPSWVRVVGMAHGLLFLAYCAAALWLSQTEGWSHRKLAYAWIASFLPAGPFVFDAKILDRPV